jgi:hypothetical protein
MGYAALTRVSPHWSASESMHSALRIDGADVAALAEGYNHSDCLAGLRRARVKSHIRPLASEHEQIRD